ncbi:putative reverse transcriptase domain-containing protein [Tanacetum coccineum]
MDDPNITMEEYIRLEEEKANRRGKVYNWETATYGKIWYDEDVHDHRSVETEFPAIAFNEKTLSCEPMVSYLNDEVDFRILFDDYDDEDCTVIFDKNLFSYKIISVNDLKTDSENDNDKVNMPLLPSPEPTVSYFDDLDYFKDFEKEFPSIVYNDTQTSKLDFLTEPTVSPQHIDEFNLKDETSLSEYKDDDDDKIDMIQSSRNFSVKPLPDVINADDAAYAHASNKLLEASHDTSNKFFKTETFVKLSRVFFSYGRMVNTIQATLEFSGPAFDEAVQRAVNALLPGLTAQITNELRQNGTEGSGDQPPTIHTYISLGFLGKKAGTQEEQGKNFKWALYYWIMDGIVNTEFTDVAHVANAARNIKILRERTGQNNKRNRDGDRIHSTAQGSSQRGYDQKRHDGRGYDRQGSSQREYDQKGYDGRSYDRQGCNGNQRSWIDRDQQDRGKACYRVTGACFSCGSTEHMARDCPKNGGNGGEGSGNDKQAAIKGRVFYSTTNHATSALGTVSGNSLSVRS